MFVFIWLGNQDDLLLFGWKIFHFFGLQILQIETIKKISVPKINLFQSYGISSTCFICDVQSLLNSQGIKSLHQKKKFLKIDTIIHLYSLWSDTNVNKNC